MLRLAGDGCTLPEANPTARIIVDEAEIAVVANEQHRMPARLRECPPDQWAPGNYMTRFGMERHPKSVAVQVAHFRSMQPSTQGDVAAHQPLIIAAITTMLPGIQHPSARFPA